MTRRSQVGAARAAVVIAATVVGCSERGARDVYPDASVQLPSRSDGAAEVMAPTSSSDALPALRALPTGLPLPKGVEPPRRLLDSAAELTGGGINSCSHQEPPSGDGDRWCVFTIPGAITNPTTNKKNAELWVVNISKAKGATVPRCDGTDDNCRLLTTNLWTEFALVGPGHPFAQAFTGDTLIFYADATSIGDDVHRGPVYAWRPGWAKARQISSDQGLACYGHEHAAVAFCLDDAMGTPKLPSSFEVRAGLLSETASGPLPGLGRVSPFNAAGEVAWQYEFSRSGDWLAISSQDADSTVETLRVIATARTADSAPTTILADLKSWAISNDGERLFFYRQETPETKSLFVAEFPTGANPLKLAENIRNYWIIGDGIQDDALAYLTDTAQPNERAFSFLRDISAPASALTVFTYRGMLEGVRVSHDLRFTTWLDGNMRARVVRHDTLTSCQLNIDDASAYGPQFLSSAALVFWSQEALDDPFRRDAYYAAADGCGNKTRLAQGIDVLRPVEGRGIIFGDEFARNDRTVTLKYAHVSALTNSAPGQLGSAIRLQNHVDPALVVVGTHPMLIVYRVKPGGQRPAGIYVFGPVPF